MVYSCRNAGVRLLAALITCFAIQSVAQDSTTGNTPTTNQQQVSFFDRPALLDGPGSPTTVMRKHGVNLNITYTEYGQGIVAGDGDHQWQFGGKFFPKLTLDGEQLAGWKGFSLNAIGEITNGDTVDTDNKTGLIFPVNTALFGPADGKYGGDLSLTVTQAIGDKFSLRSANSICLTPLRINQSSEAVVSMASGTSVLPHPSPALRRHTSAGVRSPIGHGPLRSL